jgi:hypothetical protein
MCPACMASAALMAGSVMSTGGIAALAVRIVRGKKSGEKDNSKQVTKRSNDDGNDERSNDQHGNDEHGIHEPGNDE